MRLKPFMLYLRTTPLFQYEDNALRRRVYAMLNIKYHFFSDLFFIANSAALEKWEVKNCDLRVLNYYAKMESGDIEALEEMIATKASFQQLSFIASDASKLLSGDSLTRIYDALISCQRFNSMPDSVADAMSWHHVRHGDVERLRHLIAKRSVEYANDYQVLQVPRELLNNRCDEALGAHLTSIHGDDGNISKWIRWASNLQHGTGDHHKFSSELRWPGEEFLRKLLCRTSVVDGLPPLLSDVLDACARFDKFDPREFVHQAMAALLRQSDFEGMEQMLEMLLERGLDAKLMRGDFKHSLSKAYYKGGRVMPEIMQVSPTHSSIQNFDPSKDDYLEVLRLVVTEIGRVPVGLVGGFLCKLNAEQLEMADKLLTISHRDIDPYCFPQVRKSFSSDF